MQSILTINGGSLSIKFALFEAGDSFRRILAGAIERIGQPGAVLRVKGAAPADNFSRPLAVPDYAAAVELLMDWIEERLRQDVLSAVGHRVVHGGPKYWEPQLITAEMVGDLRQLTPFDPEHLPGEILLTEAFQRRFPTLPQVACFDTAFHRDLPRVAQLLPIPRRYEAQGMRRYGFHGLSYEFLLGELAQVAGAEAAQGRVILAHLGNGASLAAVHHGKAVDTSMGFTPAAGVPMSTRSGDLDPGLVGYLARTENMSATQFNELVNFQSGLLGVSETSSDMRDLLTRETGDVRAAEAVALFCYQVRKWIGAFAAALGGLDTLVFAGGIGENAPPVRARICDGLGFLGIELDVSRNAQSAGVITTDAARTAVRVMRTDEELMIARAVDCECFVVLLLNTRRRIKGHHLVSIGTLDTILVHPREVFRVAIVAAASAILLMHNHPSGDATPSEADIKVTRDLIRAGQLLKIEVLDHVVMGNPGHTSLRELGYFFQ